MTARAQSTLLGVAGFGIDDPGRTRVALPTRPLDDGDFAALLSAARRRRVVGHLAHAIEIGAFPATDNQRELAYSAHRSAVGLDLVLERLLLDSVLRLRAANIPTRVLKGAAAAHLDYPDPALRSFGDVDLLVPGDRYDEAIALFVARGATRTHQEPRPEFDRRFGKGTCLVTAGYEEIDLHRSFASGPFGIAMTPSDLFCDGVEFHLGGEQLVALDGAARLVNACFHAALGDDPPRPVALRDIAQLALHPAVDAAAVRELARMWRCGIVVQRALDLTWSAFGIVAEPDVVRWAQRHEPTRFERRSLRAYVGQGRSYARQAVAGLWAVPGMRPKAAYVRALLVPDARYVGEREGSYARRLRRGANLVVDHVRRS